MMTGASPAGPHSPPSPPTGPRTSPPSNHNILWAGAVVDEFVRCGVRHAVVCPGSRSAPLALAMAKSGIDLTVHVDERSAAYFAVGLARATGLPAVVVTTSGTAVANLLPAVVEASQAGVPLILWTADRPHELRDVGANQAIDQIKIFGDSVRWFQDLPLPEVSEGPLRWLRSVACRAVARAKGPDPGPVHLNQPLREPLDARPEELDLAAVVTLAREGRPGGAPFHSIAAGASAPTDLTHLPIKGPGFIIAGPRSRVDGFPKALWALAAELGVPILADALSNARFGSPDGLVLSAYDAWLGSPAARAALANAWILQFGAAPTSKNLRQLLLEHRGPRIVVDETGRGHDEVATASHILQADASAVCRSLADAGPSVQAPGGAADWDAAAREIHREAPGDPQVIREILRSLSAGDQLFIGSSLPVRDLDRYAAADAAPAIRVLGNRGASGIDGVVATAAGAARAAPEGSRTILLIGDLSLHHDLNGLAAQARHAGGRLTTVVVNNHGGGIFHHLPIAADPQFEDLFATPHSWDILRVASGLGLSGTRLVGIEGLARALDEMEGGLVELIVDRSAAAAARQAVQQAVVDTITRKAS